MARFAFAIFALAVLAQSQFAIVVWSQSATDAINGGPAFASNNAVFSSQDGRVYAFGAGSGTLAWTYDMKEKTVFGAEKLDDARVAAVGIRSRLAILNAVDGSLAAQAELPSPPLSFAAGEGRAFVATNESIIAYSAQGRQVWNITQPKIGQIGVGKGKVYFVSGGKIYAVSSGSGVVKWSAEASETFLSKPFENAGTVYLGGTDGKLYAFEAESGVQRWSYKTGGWIMTTPAADSNCVYFVSNDGYAHGVRIGGQQAFRIKSKSTWAQPVLYDGKSGRIVVFADSEGQLYGLDAATGNRLWSFSAYGKPEDLSIYGSTIVFGTSKGKAYALSPLAICSFTYPDSLDAVGGWPVEVEGSASADSGIERVEVRASTDAQTGKWMAATGGESWHAPVDFSVFEAGPVNLECRVRSLDGKMDTQEFSYLLLIKADNTPLQPISAEYPYEVGPQEEFNLSAKDERGLDLRNLKLSLAGVERKGDSPFSVKLGKAGPATITIEKAGFEPLSLVVVGRGGTDYTSLFLIAVLVAAAAYFLIGKKLFGKKR